MNSSSTKKLPSVLPAFVAIWAFISCSDQFTGPLFKSTYPHQRYIRQLEHSGLTGSTLYRQWHEASLLSLADPTPISIPHQEVAYIAQDRPTAIGYAFDARQGERLQVNLAIQTIDSARVFIDLFESQLDTISGHKHLASADTGVHALTWDIRRDGRYVLRIQPELLAELSFQLQLTADPSLANPVDSAAKQHIGSVFGDSRDGGKRRHEGIDIFAARHTPVVAAANGLVTRVGENRLGGKVVWLRPSDRSITLYYAHLDSQLVNSGQLVNTGDTLGLMGTTGNARTTPPHLHFGIYGGSGAVDPLPFVRPGKSNPPSIAADAAQLGQTMRAATQIANKPANAPVRVEAVYQQGYRVVYPDSTKHFLSRRQVRPLGQLRTMQLTHQRPLYAQPDTTAAQITALAVGHRASIVAEYNGFLLVDGPIRGWILR